MDNQTILNAVKQIIYYAIGVVKLTNEFPRELIFIGPPRSLRRQKGARTGEHVPAGALWFFFVDLSAARPRTSDPLHQDCAVFFSHLQAFHGFLQAYMERLHGILNSLIQCL